VAYVGLLERTFYTSPSTGSGGTAGNAVFDVDYFRLQRYGPAAPVPYTETEQDDFDGPLSPRWDWYVPKTGPTYSFNAQGLRISCQVELVETLPAGEPFDHDTYTDDAPQLRRTDLGDSDWAIETRLLDINGGADAGTLTGLEIGFSQFDQVWFGMGQDSRLNVYQVGGDWPDTVQQSLPLYLRIEKRGETYPFKYRQSARRGTTRTKPGRACRPRPTPVRPLMWD